jgi:hypothetical protein
MHILILIQTHIHIPKINHQILEIDEVVIVPISSVVKPA